MGDRLCVFLFYIMGMVLPDYMACRLNDRIERRSLLLGILTDQSLEPEFRWRFLQHFWIEKDSWVQLIIVNQRKQVWIQRISSVVFNIQNRSIFHTGSKTYLLLGQTCFFPFLVESYQNHTISSILLQLLLFFAMMLHNNSFEKENSLCWELE